MSWWPAGEYRTISLKPNTKRIGRGRWWSFHSTFRSHPCLYSLSAMLWLVDLAHWLSFIWWKAINESPVSFALSKDSHSQPSLLILVDIFLPRRNGWQLNLIASWMPMPPQPKGLLKFHGLRKNSMQTSHICHI